MLPLHGQYKYGDIFPKYYLLGLERHKGEKLWHNLFITIIYLTQQVE